MSFWNILTKIEIGVTTIKKIINITIGAIILPKISPNLIQYLFKGNKILDLINPKNKKIIDKMIDHNLISFSFNKGHKPITRKTKKKSIPKLLDEFFWDIKLN